MISVCMATYNGEKYITEQIASILKQLDDNDEVIISDDGSKDRTIDIINQLNDTRIKIFHNTGKHGFTRNFENALKHANGDYIFLADQDDIWLDNKVKIVMDKLKDFDFVTHDCITIDSNGDIISNSRFKDFNIRGGFWRHMVKSRFLGCCMAFRGDFLKVALPFPLKEDFIEHDIWLAALAFKFYRYNLIEEPLIYYRRHGGNASDGGFKQGYSLGNKIYRRLYRIKCVYFRKKRIHS